ncbi:MAG: FapA family protein [Candidatus Wallbacteria bacterium]|nr:FapA family protein [Candidatus Wallbacteria bacterium]
MTVRLSVLAPAGAVHDFNSDQIIIGKSADCDLVLQCSGVSKKHACLFRDETGFLIRDMESTTGTRVNKKDIRGLSARLEHDDLIEIGEATLRFESSQGASPVTVSGSESRTGAQKFLCLLAEMPPDALMVEILTHFQTVMGVDNAVILVKSLYSEELFPFFNLQGRIRTHVLPALRISKTLSYKSFNEATPLLLTNAQRNKEFSTTSSIVSFNICSVLIFPLVLNKNTLGVLYLSSVSTRLSKADLIMVENLAPVISLLSMNLMLRNDEKEEKKETPDFDNVVQIKSIIDKIQQSDREKVRWHIPMRKETQVKSGQIIGEFSASDLLSLQQFHHSSLFFDMLKKVVVARSNGLAMPTDESVVFKKFFQYKGDIDKKMGPINFDGQIQVLGEIDSTHAIQCLYDLEVSGKVRHSNLTSLLGGISVKSYVLGEGKNVVKALGNIAISSPYNTYLKTFSNVIVDTNLLGTVINASQTVLIDCKGRFEDNIISAGQKIHIKKIPSRENYGYLELKINSSESLAEVIRERNTAALEYSRISDLLNRNRPLYDQIIGNPKVLDHVRQSRHEALTGEVKKFLKLQREETFLREKILIISDIIRSFKTFKPEIIVEDKLPPGTTVFINGACLELESLCTRTVFREENGQVVQFKL